MTKLLPVSIDNKDGEVIISLRAPDGATFDVSLNTMDATSLMTGISLQVTDILKQPHAPLMGMPLHHVQYVENEEAVFFRAFVSSDIYHEYRTPKNTTLSTALKAFVDAYEAAAMKLAMHQAPGQTKN